MSVAAAWEGVPTGSLLLDYPTAPLPGLPPGPNLRQALAHHLAPWCDEVLFGGARGGGKTDWLLAEALRRLHQVDGMQAVVFRRTYKELMGPSGIAQRLFSRIPRHRARWSAQDKRWTFINDSTLSLSYLETIEDVRAWLGLELQLMVFDQVEQLDPDTYRMVRTSLRASGELAGRMTRAGYRASSIATANPGDVGHAWVKQRFIDPFPDGQGTLFRAAPTEDDPRPGIRCFVKSLLVDNPALDQGDPGYRAILEGLPADERAAHLEGDWNVFKGARFAGFRTGLHVVTPESMPVPPGAGIPRAIGVDYGMTNPFVALWGARLADDLIVVYREVDAVGLSPAEQAQLVLASMPPEEHGVGRPVPSALDPACWAADPNQPEQPRMPGQVGVPDLAPRGSIAARYRQAGLGVVRADNRRVEGATAVATALKPRADGTPGLLIYSTCRNLIRTLPALQRDPKRPEDVLKADVDHWYDALRYLLGLLGLIGPPAGTGPGVRRQPATTVAPGRGASVGATRPGRLSRRTGF